MLLLLLLPYAWAVASPISWAPFLPLSLAWLCPLQVKQAEEMRGFYKHLFAASRNSGLSLQCYAFALPWHTSLPSESCEEPAGAFLS